MKWGAWCAAGLILVLAGCRKPADERHAAENLPTARVRVMPAAEKTYTAAESVTGTVRSKTRATLEAKVSGRIDKMLVGVGQMVKEGELLIELDGREIQARLDQAKAVLEQTAQDRKRSEALLEQKALTQQEFEAIRARARVAEATATEASTMLGYTKITSPFAGVVTRKLADMGDIASPGRPLLELEDPGALRLESDFPEALIGRIQLGDKLPVRITSSTNAWEGVVGEISPTADPGSRTFRVKLDLPPATQARLGQFGRVAVPIGEITTLRVPESALVVRGQMEIVFVVANQKAQLRLVNTGKRFEQELEILAGLHAGDPIVAEGASTLTDGQPVEVK
jgi:RND family efflux transporter MFP subunit